MSPRAKPASAPAALANPLLGAVIAHLPAPERGAFPAPEREAWITMARNAFDVVYGPAACAEFTTRLDRPAAVAFESGTPGAVTDGAHKVSAAPSRHFTVDPDGFAMGDGTPIAMDDLPDGAILWDQRIGIERGDVSAIMWRDIGTTRKSLPPGVTLKSPDSGNGIKPA